MEATGPNAAQIAHWNGKAGENWVRFHTEQDGTIRPLGNTAIEAAGIRPGEHVLDIGCGCGDTTLILADRVGATGSVTGVDISAVMLRQADTRATGHPNVTFKNADAEHHTLQEGNFDVVFSRFGVMFFRQPERAFANLRRALKPGGRLAFLCWQARDANPFFTVPLSVAHNHTVLPPPVAPDEPGPFAFADQRRVHRILESAGFTEIGFARQETRARIAGTPDFGAAIAFLMRIGPMASALAGVSPKTRGKIQDDLAVAIQPYYRGDGVYLRTQTWVVTAQRSA